MAPSSPSNAGNAVDIAGLLPVSQGGTTTPNLSTRAQITNIGAGVFNNPTATITGNLLGFSPSTPLFSNFLGKVDVNVDASTTTGITEPLGMGMFSGSSAIGAGTAYGVGNSALEVSGSLVDPNDPTLPGSYFAEAIARGSSAASTGYGVDSAGNPDPDNASAAAVLDIASVGSNSKIIIGGGTGSTPSTGIAGALNFNATTIGQTSATGIEVGKVTAPGSGPVNNNAVVPGTPGTTNYATAVDPLDGTGVNSILNIQARGYNNQTQFFQQPISPFFAQFSGLVPGPNADQPLNPPQDLTGRADGDPRILRTPSGNVNAGSTVSGINTASNKIGNTNAFTGAFSTGMQLANAAFIDGNGSFAGTSALDTDTSSTASTEGSSSAITNVLSNGIGTSAIRTVYDAGLALAPVTLYLAGDGRFNGQASATSTTSATSGTGDVVAFTGGLTGSGGNTFAQDFNAGNALSVGLFNVQIDGRGDNTVSGVATSNYETSATSTVRGDAKAAATAVTAGILGNDTSTGSLVPNNIFLRGSQGVVVGFAEASNTVDSVATLGNASSGATTQAFGIFNEAITISGSGSIGGTGISVTNSSASA